MAMASLNVWAKALRLPFLTATVVPVLLGSSIAWYEIGAFHWGLFLLTLLGVTFLHLATNSANDYYDHLSGNDAANKNPTKFSGGSRVIQEKLIDPLFMRNVSLLFLFCALMIGGLLYWIVGYVLIIQLTVIGSFIGFFYSSPPFKLGSRGFGELLTGICFGPLVVVGSYAVQTGFFSFTALAASVPVGLLIALVLFINEIPDEEADKEVGKQTLVVILGKKEAISLYHFFLIACYLFIMAGILLKSIPLAGIMTLLTLPMAVKAYNTSAAYIQQKRQDIRTLLPANEMTIALHLTIGILLSLSYVLASFF